ERMRPTDDDGVTEYVIVSVWRSREELERYKAVTDGPTIAPELAHTVDRGSVEEYDLLASDEYEL
ncbi:MAG TPA: hypothetical protein VFV98_17225, partial [Vicinamibacterales bacterium]|nr:hypothetical protein [Vicinamibacterales bacterium]